MVGSAPPARFADAEDQLHALAAARAGGDNFGDAGYLTGLRVLLASMDYDPVFSPSGRALAWDQIANSLTARAHAAQAGTRVDITGVEISRPLVIIGIPRTGTTALHKMLALDPQFQGLQSWLTCAPMPRPSRESWAENPLFRRAEARLDTLFDQTPGMRAAHNVLAEEVDECQEILRQTFVSNCWASSWSAANYDVWWQTQSELSSYRYLRDTLRMIGSNEPDKRWLLKNPGHVANLDLLFAVFPDACVVQTHRDPAKAIPSLCALLLGAHRAFEVGRIEERARWIGLRETEKWAKAVHDAEPVRQRHADQIVDVRHADFHRDPIGQIARIYAHFGLRLMPEVEAAIRRRSDEAPELAHGTHRYDIGDFGLTDEAVFDRFGDYIDRFGLRPSRASVT